MDKLCTSRHTLSVASRPRPFSAKRSRLLRSILFDHPQLKLTSITIAVHQPCTVYVYIVDIMYCVLWNLQLRCVHQKLNTGIDGSMSCCPSPHKCGGPDMRIHSDKAKLFALNRPRHKSGAFYSVTSQFYPFQALLPYCRSHLKISPPQVVSTTPYPNETEDDPYVFRFPFLEAQVTVHFERSLAAVSSMTATG